MGVKIKRLGKIWLLGLYSRIMQRLEYRFNFFVMVVGGIIQMSLMIAFVNIIFNYINNLSGWNYDQAMIIVGSYMMVDGFLWGTCAYLFGLSLHIREGTLDTLIVKPADTQFLVTASQGDPEDWVKFAIGLMVFLNSLIKLDIGLANLMVNTPFYLLMMLNSIVIIYSISLIIRSIAFWSTDASNFWYVIDNLTKISQYPADIFFNKIVKIFFYTIIPAAFIATVPAEIMIHGPNFYLILSSTIVAIIFFFASRKFFNFALKDYSSASS